jgi:hypothetical protein
MLPIKITRGASVQIQEAAGWWSANRPKAPGAFAEDLRRAFQLISLQPKIGTRAATTDCKAFAESISVVFDTICTTASGRNGSRFSHCGIAVVRENPIFEQDSISLDRC